MPTRWECSRREFVKTAALGAAGLTLPASALAAFEQGRRPNIIVVLCDDLGYGDLGCYGSPVIKTPNLDRLAREGVRFTSFYAAAPNCSPSRAGLLTGRTPYRSGMYDVITVKKSRMSLPENEITVAEVLCDAGYETCQIGKWHLTSARGAGENALESAALLHGFDHADMRPDMATDAIRLFNGWIDQRSDPRKPFFAYIALNEPHEPVDKRCPPVYRRQYEGVENERLARTVPYGGVVRKMPVWDDRNAYYGCVSQVDDAVGALAKHLAATGLEDDTIVLFTSDNGPDYRCRHSFGSPGPLRGAKGQVYDGGIRVPGIMYSPGRLNGGTVCDEPVSFLDFLPTACALAGVEAPKDRVIDGVNFLPALEGRPLERKIPLFWSMWAARGGPQYALRDGDWKILAKTEPLAAETSVIDHIKKGKFVGFELYNLRNDLAETTDLSTKNPEEFERLKTAFITLHNQVVAEGPYCSLEEHRDKARWAWPDP